MASIQDTKRQNLLTRLSVALAPDLTNTDLERKVLLASSGLSETQATGLSNADLREKAGIPQKGNHTDFSPGGGAEVTPTGTYGTALYGTGTYA